MGAVSCGFTEWDCRKELTLLRDGTAVVGRVVSRAGGLGAIVNQTITYQYLTGNGVAVRRSAMVRGSAFHLLSNGGPATVLYMDAAPEKGLPYLAMSKAEVVTRR